MAQVGHASPEPAGRASRAHVVIEALNARGATLGIAESLTGGILCDAFVSVPGTSSVLRGSITAYAPEAKARVLGVDTALLEEHGTVHPEVARQMARGAAEIFEADYAVATTGVAGPGPTDGHPAGTVYLAALAPGVVATRYLLLAGPRAAVRTAAVEAGLALLGEVLRD